MHTLKSFLKATLVGGLLFLVPVVLLLVVLRHALAIATKLATPIAKALPATSALGVPMVTLVAIALLLVLALLAGLVARTRPGRRMTQWFEESLLGSLPQYRMVKSVAEGLTQIETGAGLQPVLVGSDEAWQLGYLIEELHDGWVAVFMPSAPTPMSGNVAYVSRDRIRILDLPMSDAIRIVKQLGTGSAAALQKVDLGPPR